MKVWILYGLGGALLIVGLIAWTGSRGKPERSPQGTLGSAPVAPGRMDLARVGATVKEYYRASREQKQAFCDHFTTDWFGHPDELAADELRMYLERRRGLPATTDERTMMLAAMGKTPLWEAAVGAANALGWPPEPDGNR